MELGYNFLEENRDMILVIVMIVLKGTIRDFCNLLNALALQTASNTYAQVARAQSCANHVQDIERLSLAHVVCHPVRRDSPAIKFDRVEIAVIFAFYLAETFSR